jgi:hypothetical protein
MLEFLRTTGKASDRKLRLFAVACCRAAWGLFRAQAVRAAVETSERYADGQVTAAALENARSAAARLAERAFRRHVRARPWALTVRAKFARQAAAQVASPDIADVLEAVDPGLTSGRTRASYEQNLRQVRMRQCGFLRDLFGPLPFRAVAVDPACRTPAVVALAKAVYDDRRWEEMPVLGDALEESGCRDDAVLTHCRSPGTHARGCFVLDLLLDKE